MLRVTSGHTAASEMHASRRAMQFLSSRKNTREKRSCCDDSTSAYDLNNVTVELIYLLQNILF